MKPGNRGKSSVGPKETEKKNHAKGRMLTLDGSVKGGLIESRNVGVDGALKARLHRVRDVSLAKAVEGHTVLGLRITTIVFSS